MRRTRWATRGDREACAIAFGGACAGLGGAYISLVRVPQWTEGMTAGAGWIALAIVVFAAWRPLGVLVGAYLFGGVDRTAVEPAGCGTTGAGRTLVDVPLPDNDPRARGDVGPGAGVAGRAGVVGPTVSRIELRRAGREFGVREEGKTYVSQNVVRRGRALRHERRPGRRAQDEPVKVGFIYVGPDRRRRLDVPAQPSAARGGGGVRRPVETVYHESVPEGADAERVLTQMALSGADLIFTTSFGYMDATMNVAEKFPT